MQHAKGSSQALPVLTTAPTTNGQGVLLSNWTNKTQFGTQPKRFICKLVVTGGAGTVYALYANESIAPTVAVWGIPVDAGGNLGLVCNGASFVAGTYFFIVEDIGVFGEVVLVRTSGAGTATATISSIIELAELA